MPETQHYGQVVDLFEAEGSHFAKIADLEEQAAYLVDLGEDDPAVDFGFIVKFKPRVEGATIEKTVAQGYLPDHLTPIIDRHSTGTTADDMPGTARDTDAGGVGMKNLVPVHIDYHVPGDHDVRDIACRVVKVLGSQMRRINNLVMSTGFRHEIPHGSYLIVDQKGEFVSVRMRGSGMHVVDYGVSNKKTKKKSRTRSQRKRDNYTITRRLGAIGGYRLAETLSPVDVTPQPTTEITVRNAAMPAPSSAKKSQ